MRLTPLEIRHKEFSRAMRGYKDIEVDEFLDDIADEFERVFNENIDFRERLETLEEKIEQYKNIEETLKKTLLSAQQQAEELKHNAKKESDLILRDAELKSRSILNDCYAERQKIQRSVQSLKQRQEDLRYQLRSVLESYMNILDQDGEAEVEFDDALEIDSAGAGEAGMEAAAIADPEEGEAAGGIDAAVSSELLAGGDIDDMAPADTADEPAGVFLEPEAPAGDQEEPADEPPPAGPAAAGEEEDDDDPFADLEIDTEGREFKW